jgi:hypothetical protein
MILLLLVVHFPNRYKLSLLDKKAFAIPKYKARAALLLTKSNSFSKSLPKNTSFYGEIFVKGKFILNFLCSLKSFAAFMFV